MMVKNVPKRRQLGAKLGPSWDSKIVLATLRGEKRGLKIVLANGRQKDAQKTPQHKPVLAWEREARLN